MRITDNMLSTKVRVFCKVFSPQSIAADDNALDGRSDLASYKESRQKRLVEHRKYILKTSILQYVLDRAANRLHSLGGINLNSLSSRKHTTTIEIEIQRRERRAIGR